jgi:hypothetical protein
MKIGNIITIIFILAAILILALSLRGLPGNPTAEELNTSEWKENGPFELSPERGRFTLLYSVVEDKSLTFSESLAKFTMPDLAISPSGHYVSMFTPGVSFLALPGYIIGKYLGNSQAGSFAIISFFALMNLILIRSIAIRLGSNPIAASIGSFAFIFATPAFSYAGTLYQHHISTFLILLSVYALFNWKGYLSLTLIWFLAALSLVVDNPNLFIMLPIAIYALGKIIIIKKGNNCLNVKIKLFAFSTLIGILFPIVFFLSFNKASNENPFQLSGTLPSAQITINQDNDTQVISNKPFNSIMELNQKNEKNAVGFLKTRNLTNGFYVLFLSPDRGMINYAPIIFFGVFGFYLLYKKNSYFTNLLVAIIGFNVLLYSMWGDPYGGWAFGSRYLIPTYAMLGIGIGVFLTHWKKNSAILIIFIIFFVYSSRVNTLGALTSNANPPKIEVLELERITTIEQKYTYARNEQYLENNRSKSFIFQAYLKDKVSAKTYYLMVYSIIIATFLMLIFSLRFSSFDFKKVLYLIRIK